MLFGQANFNKGWSPTAPLTPLPPLTVILTKSYPLFLRLALTLILKPYLSKLGPPPPPGCLLRSGCPCPTWHRKSPELNNFLPKSVIQYLIHTISDKFRQLTFPSRNGHRASSAVQEYDRRTVRDKTNLVFIVSSDRSSYSDIIRPQRPLFEISSISANIFSFSFWELNADW